jgi:RNA:NAD 2'-phosphotransferase (TPT1/KptA family)
MASSSYSQAGVASPHRARSDSANEASYVLRHYDVDRTIGEGGFAKVKLAKVSRGRGKWLTLTIIAVQSLAECKTR